MSGNECEGTQDYEALREKNIAERNAFLREFLQGIKEDAEEINKLENRRKSIIQKENITPKTPKSSTKKRRSVANSDSVYGSKVTVQIYKKYNTRSRKRKHDNDSDIDSENDEELYDGRDIIVSKKSSNLKVMFPWARPMQRDIDLMKFDFSDEDADSSSESENEIPVIKKRIVHRKSVVDPDSILAPEQVTQRMLDNIAPKASGKVYDAVNGTSCHQCRQKTKDTKTVCRSGICIGVRGQFCGPCLQGRYGECAKQALLDPEWSCPTCRGLCNCSICRTRNGQRPTGILAPTAKEEGYNSVKDYLLDLED